MERDDQGRTAELGNGAPVGAGEQAVRSHSAVAARHDASRVLLTRAFSLAGMALIAWRLFFTLHH